MSRVRPSSGRVGFGGSRPTSALRLGLSGSSLEVGGQLAAPTTGFTLAGQSGGAFMEHAPAAVAFVVEPAHRAEVQAWVAEARDFLQPSQTARANRAAVVATTPDDTTPVHDDLLSGACLGLAVRLMPNLCHHSTHLRSGAMHLVLRLGAAFGHAAAESQTATGVERKKSEPKAGGKQDEGKMSDAERKQHEQESRNNEIVQRAMQEPDDFSSLHLFFSLLGPALSPLVLALVDRLESNYLHPHTVVRDASILVCANLMRLHAGLFVKRDHLVAVWNLFFLLDLLSTSPQNAATAAHTHATRAQAAGNATSMARFSGVSSSSTTGGGVVSLAHLVPSLPLSGARLSIISSLGMICGLFVAHDVSLTTQIVGRLLRLPEKSARETRAIEEAVLAIGAAALEHARTEAAQQAAAQQATSTSFAAFSQHSAAADAAAASPTNTYSLYPVFLSCLSAHDEDHLDVLAWCLFAYTANLQRATWNENIARATATTTAVSRGSAVGTAASLATLKRRELIRRRDEIDALFYGLPPITTPSASPSPDATATTHQHFSTRYPSELLRTPRESVVLPRELSDFLPALENHLRAGPPLIRFGAAQSLASVLRVYPSALAWSGSLWPHVLLGVMDEHVLTARCYMGVLRRVAQGLADDRLTRMIDRCENDEFNATREDQQQTRGNTSTRITTATTADKNRSQPAHVDSAPHSTAASEPPPSLKDILDRAISLAPAVPSRFLGFILANLSHRPLAMQVRHLQLVRVCARTLTEVESVFSQKLMSLLSDGSGAGVIAGGGGGGGVASFAQSEIASLVVGVFRAIPTPLLSQLDDQLLVALADHFQQTIELARTSDAEQDGTALDEGLDDATVAERIRQTLDAVTHLPWDSIQSVPLSSSSRPTGADSSVSHSRLSLLLHTCVTRLLLHPSRRVRGVLYEMVERGVSANLWSSTRPLLSLACGIAFAGLGDVAASNVTLAHAALVRLVEASNRSMRASSETRPDLLLDRLHTHRARLTSASLLPRIRAYDQVARVLVHASEPAQESIRLVYESVLGDEPAFKDFTARLYATVVTGAAASQRPAMHAHWWALVGSHGGQLLRQRVPVMMLAPLLGADERQVRVATCHAMKRACALITTVNDRLVHDLLATVTSLLDGGSGTGVEEESAYRLLASLVPLKLKRLNSHLVSTLLPRIIERMTQPTLTHFVRHTMLLLVEAMILVHPRLCTPQLERLRNAMREMIGHVHTTAGTSAAATANARTHARSTSTTEKVGGASAAHLQLISRVYSLVCFTACHYAAPTKTASSSDDAPRNDTALAYVAYLCADLASLSGGAAASSADPLLTRLTSGQLQLVGLITLHALGCIESRDAAPRIIDEVTPFLAHTDAHLRFLAAEAMQTQLPLVTDERAAFARWALMPLLADAEITVRIAAERALRPAAVVLSSVRRLISLLPAEASDEFEGEEETDEGESETGRPKSKSTTKPAATDNTFALAPSTPLDVCVASLLALDDEEEPFYARDGVALAPDARAHPSPHIGPTFFRTLQTLVRERVRHFPSDRFDELVYHLQQTLKLAGTRAAATLVLAQVATAVAEHTEQATSVLKLLLLQLDRSLNSLTRPLIFGCVLAVQSICCHRRARSWSVGMLFDYVSSLAGLREGDLVALRSIAAEPKLPLATLVTHAQVQAVTNKLVSTLRHPRTSTIAQQMALEVLASLCLQVDVGDVSDIIDFIFGMLDQRQDNEFHEACGEQLGKLFASLPTDHPLVETFSLALAIDVKSPRVESRLRALTTLVILQSRLTFVTRAAYFLRLLADPHRELLNPHLSQDFSIFLLPVVKQMLSVAHDRPVAARKAGSAASVSMEDLTDSQLLRMRDDATDAYQRQVQQDAFDEQSNLLPARSLESSSSSLGSSAFTSSGDSSPPLFTIPLKDADPLNLRFLHSHTFLRLLRCYGMERPTTSTDALQGHQQDAYTAYQQLTGPNDPAGSGVGDVDAATAEDLPTVLDRLSQSKRGDLLADIRAKQCAHMDFAPLLAALLRQDQGRQAAALMTELMQLFEKIEQEAPSSPASPSPSTSDTLQSSSLELDLKLHTLGVIMNLLHAFLYATTPPSSSAAAASGGGAHLLTSSHDRAQIASKLHASLTSLQATSTQFRTHAESLRARTMAAVQQLHSFRGPAAGTKWSSSVRTEAAFQRREQYMGAMMAPTPRVDGSSGGGGSNASAGGSSGPSKQDILEQIRCLERDITRWGVELAHTTLLQTRVVQCVTRVLLRASEAQIDSARLITSYAWLSRTFVDTHRGVRESVRDSLVSLCDSRCGSYANHGSSGGDSDSVLGRRLSLLGDPFLQHVQKSVGILFQALKDPASPAALLSDGDARANATPPPSWFHRRRPRSDLLHLLARLIPYAANGKMRVDVVPLLISFWDDADSDVRRRAIDAVQRLLRTNYPEILPFAQSAEKHRSSAIIKAIMQRVRDEQYGEKDHLNQLLNFFFTQK